MWSTLGVTYAFVAHTLISHIDASEYKPHPGCSGSASYTNCDGFSSSVKFLLPTDFNVSLLHPDTADLVIKEGVVQSNFIPFPVRTKLVSLVFTTFNTLPTEIRFPINPLLVNVKSTIKKLTFSNVPLTSLTSADFYGFSKLEIIELLGCFLSTISSSTFEELYSPSFIVQQTLVRIYIYNGNHKLEALDWSFVRPVSRSLNEISVLSSHLNSTNLTCSVPFTSAKLTKINLTGNNLRILPATVYNTFNVSLPLELSLHNNVFCQKTSDCSCCDIYPFVKWLQQNNQSSAVKTISCGSSGSISYLSKQTSYQHCDEFLQNACPAEAIDPQINLGPTIWPTSTVAVVASSSSRPVTIKVTPTKKPNRRTTTSNPADNCGDFRTIDIECSKGLITFSEPDVNLTDALSAVLTVDNTLACRTVMHSAHGFLLPRVKRGVARHDVPPTVVECRKGTLHISDDKPDDSEAIELTFTTTGNLPCRLLFVDFLNHISSFIK